MAGSVVLTSLAGGEIAGLAQAQRPHDYVSVELSDVPKYVVETKCAGLVVDVGPQLDRAQAMARRWHSAFGSFVFLDSHRVIPASVGMPFPETIGSLSNLKLKHGPLEAGQKLFSMNRQLTRVFNYLLYGALLMGDDFSAGNTDICTISERSSNCADEVVARDIATKLRQEIKKTERKNFVNELLPRKARSRGGYRMDLTPLLLKLKSEKLYSTSPSSDQLLTLRDGASVAELAFVQALAPSFVPALRTLNKKDREMFLAIAVHVAATRLLRVGTDHPRFDEINNLRSVAQAFANFSENPSLMALLISELLDDWARILMKERKNNLLDSPLDLAAELDIDILPASFLVAYFNIIKSKSGIQAVA